jgi:ribosomal protein S18 acetylase RimI-like enzyme
MSVPDGRRKTVPASTLADAELMALFNRVYSDYFVPVTLNEAAWQGLVRRFDIDLEASRVTADGGGIALLGLRGARGWVGGMGVAPEARRRGDGRLLMETLIEQARLRAVTEVGLEVLEQNAPAIALYEALGFRRFRMLDVWSLSAPLEPGRAREVDAADALAWIASKRTAPEPWQRADESVRRFAAPGQPLRGLELREQGQRTGAAVAIVVAGRASLLQLAVTGERPVEQATALCAAARAWAPVVRFLNVPSEDPAAAALREAGGLLEARQLEMTLPVPAKR